MDMNLGEHISSRYNEELESIRVKVLEMGGLVESQLKSAIMALASADSEAAQSVIDGDLAINNMEVEIDEMCTKLIARRQPAARDLRLIVSTYKAINDLERMGDEAQRVAIMAKELAHDERPKDNYSELRHLGELVMSMVKDALDCFARSDEKLAAEVIKKDRQADEEYEAVIRQSMTFMMQNTQAIPRFLNVIWAARALERIGDRATNISEYVIYFVIGKNVSHLEIKDQIDF